MVAGFDEPAVTVADPALAAGHEPAVVAGRDDLVADADDLRPGHQAVGFDFTVIDASGTSSPAERIHGVVVRGDHDHRLTGLAGGVPPGEGVIDDGKTVAANAASVQAAAANADWAKSDGFYLIITDQPGAEAWPISASTFILMPKQVKDVAASQAALKFFKWAFDNGDQAAAELDYVPMPANVKALIEKSWSEIKGPDGKSLAAM